mmetsp:Transcript_21946/g.34082  ORF Transcript_21946/g.34082 Transcript_21946/m.34082 type:complete len:215 (+) Transcript_21946:181-825(+)
MESIPPRRRSARHTSGPVPSGGRPGKTRSRSRPAESGRTRAPRRAFFRRNSKPRGTGRSPRPRGSPGPATPAFGPPRRPPLPRERPDRSASARRRCPGGAHRRFRPESRGYCACGVPVAACGRRDIRRKPTRGPPSLIRSRRSDGSHPLRHRSPYRLPPHCRNFGPYPLRKSRSVRQPLQPPPWPHHRDFRRYRDRSWIKLAEKDYARHFLQSP